MKTWVAPTLRSTQKVLRPFDAACEVLQVWGGMLFLLHLSETDPHMICCPLSKGGTCLEGSSRKVLSLANFNVLANTIKCTALHVLKLHQCVKAWQRTFAGCYHALNLSAS